MKYGGLLELMIPFGVFRMAVLVDRTVHTLLLLMWQVVFSTHDHNDIFYHIHFSRILLCPHQEVEYIAPFLWSAQAFVTALTDRLWRKGHEELRVSHTIAMHSCLLSWDACLWIPHGSSHHGSQPP